MPVLNRKTIEKIKALDGAFLIRCDSGDQVFEVTDAFVRQIDRVVSTGLRCYPMFADPESQKALHDFAKFVESNDNIHQLEYQLAQLAFLYYSEAYDGIKIPIDSVDFAEGCEGKGWLLDALQLLTRKKGIRKPISHDVNEFREVLYTNVMVEYVNHTLVKATSTEHSIFWDLMDAVVADPKINLKIKDHKPHILKSQEIMEINNLFPDDLLDCS